LVDIDAYFGSPPYSLDRESKRARLTETLGALTRHHYQACPEYRRILDAMQFEPNSVRSPEELPFLPVRLFKEYELRSVDRTEVVKTMTSSGTTGQQVSRIFLDKTTAALQTKALSRIVASYLGPKRVPMLILDTAAVVKDRAMFSARGAGILGFSMFSTDRVYALDENMSLDRAGIEAFLAKHAGEDLLVFGFTSIVWQHFVQELARTEFRPDLSRATMLHGGGWKKLRDQAVSAEAFKGTLRELCGIARAHDYYGMVEQTGTIAVECERGVLHVSVFSEVIIRRARDFGVADVGEPGIIEVLSILPGSYPGHALLTEDEGVLLGEDDCPCGRFGKYFKVSGRIRDAEIRGCSDTYQAGQAGTQ
jgi:phenylacetate-coenzyme A ligase PaaK-like adenylate-forming protein